MNYLVYLIIRYDFDVMKNLESLKEEWGSKHSHCCVAEEEEAKQEAHTHGPPRVARGKETFGGLHSPPYPAPDATPLEYWTDRSHRRGETETGRVRAGAARDARWCVCLRRAASAEKGRVSSLASRFPRSSNNGSGGCPPRAPRGQAGEGTGRIHPHATCLLPCHAFFSFCFCFIGAAPRLGGARPQ